MKNKGFTLIEMLVVIGIIGILAAVVLTALGPSRNKAKDTRIISAVNQMRSVAETKFNPSDSTYAYLSTDYAALTQDVTNNGSALVVEPADGAGSSYTAYAQLVSDSSMIYCADSTGFGGTLSQATPAVPGSNCQ